jgi:hypothetical protein
MKDQRLIIQLYIAFIKVHFSYIKLEDSPIKIEAYSSIRQTLLSNKNSSLEFTDFTFFITPSK